MIDPISTEIGQPLNFDISDHKAQTFFCTSSLHCLLCGEACALCVWWGAEGIVERFLPAMLAKVCSPKQYSRQSPAIR